MNEDDIRTPEELDAALVDNVMRRREKLWKVAEGHSVRSADVIITVAGSLLLIIGFYSAYFTGSLDALPQIALGSVLIACAAFRHQQAKIHALRELLQANPRNDGASRARR